MCQGIGIGPKVEIRIRSWKTEKSLGNLHKKFKLKKFSPHLIFPDF